MAHFNRINRPLAKVLSALAFLLAVLVPSAVQAQPARQSTNITAELVAAGPAVAGQELTLAIHFTPGEGWHGYWENPGDAGFGMELDWKLPPGWTAGKPQYPVPHQLLLSGLMNHVYEGPYAVLIPVKIPAGELSGQRGSLSVDARWLACTDVICVPEQAALTAPLPAAPDKPLANRFSAWRAAIPAMLDRNGTFAISGDRLRLAIPLPASLSLPDPHVYIQNTGLVEYAGAQNFFRNGDMLIADLPLAMLEGAPDQVAGILAFGRDDGVRFIAKAGLVPAGGTPLVKAATATPPLWTLILGALAGGLLLNIMPCVFPILSLKALSLVRAGASESIARREGVAYTAGVVLACLTLGGVLLALRAAGEQVGWAFQLQQPGVVVALLVLATAITANFAGLFELPSLPITRSGEPAGAFATGLLAAFVATPCTGPFMAAALGAALLLPVAQAMLLFAMLGLGLALPFLLLGFVPALRRILPRPGPWMARFRHLMAVPMGLTVLALLWLSWRLGGQAFALVALALTLLTMIGLAITGWRQRRGMSGTATLALSAAGLALLTPLALPAAEAQRSDAESALGPVEFSTGALAQARADGRPVFLWFTADWCLTCKVNEQVAIERQATKDAFAAANVLAMRGDWTRRDPAITEYLTSKGAAGVPLYVWISPTGEEQVLPQVLAPDSLITLANSLPPESRSRLRDQAPQ